MQELIGLWIDSLAEGDRRTVELVERGFGMVNRGDLGALAGMVGEGLVAVDHRPASWPDLDKAGWLARLATNDDLTPAFSWVAEYLRLDDTVALMLRGERREDREYHDLELGVRDGDVFTRIERFPLDQLEAAIARFNELVGPAAEEE